MLATYRMGMPCPAAMMTLVPSPRPMSTAPRPMSVMRSGSIWFWSVTSRPASAYMPEAFAR